MRVEVVEKSASRERECREGARVEIVEKVC